MYADKNYIVRFLNDIHPINYSEKKRNIKRIKPTFIAQTDFKDIRGLELELQNNVRNKAGYFNL